MEKHQDLIDALSAYEGGLRRFFQDSSHSSQCKHKLCNHTESPNKILNFVGADPDIITQAMDYPKLYDKNFYMYNHFEIIDDSKGLINALDDTNNKKALEKIREALIKLEKVKPQALATNETAQRTSEPFLSSARNEPQPSTSSYLSPSVYDGANFSHNRNSSGTQSPDQDVSNLLNDSRAASDSSLLPSSSPTVATANRSSRYSLHGQPDDPLKLEERLIIHEGTKTVSLKWIKIKAKHLAQACQNCQATLKHIRIDNIILIPPERSKLLQKFTRGQCHYPNLMEFYINEAASSEMVRKRALKSLMFFTSVDFNFDKTPTLCSVMQESELNTISYKKGGITFIHLKKEERNLKLVLHDLTFVKCEAFLKDASLSFKTLSFSAYRFLSLKTLDRSLRTFQDPLQVTELILIKVCLNPGSEFIHKFINLTKLIIHINKPNYDAAENTNINISNCFNINVCSLLSNLKNLNRLALRHVPLVGSFSTEDKGKIMRFKSVMFYMCPLERIEGILNNCEKEANPDWRRKVILLWKNEAGEKNSLVWDIENAVHPDLYFDCFQMSDFFNTDVWISKYANDFCAT